MKPTKPADYQVENPEVSLFWDARLKWMLDNQPQRVLSLFQENKLDQHLDEKATKAMQLSVWLEYNKGVPENQADEVAMREIVIPESQEPGPQLHVPLTREQRRQILNWSYDLLSERYDQRKKITA